jgi:exopolysaccharide production repressor protein
MSLPVFLRGMLLLLAAFGIVSYATTGSAWVAFANSILCALLLQVGYFVAVLCMIRSAERELRRSDRPQPTSQ